MQTSQAGIDLIKHFTGCRLKSYADPLTGGDPWTIGWGATGPDIKPGTVWTQEQADARLLEHLAEFEELVHKHVTHSLTQGQFDAFVSLIYNVGPGGKNRDGIIRLKSGMPSTLLRKFNAGDIQGAEEQWTKWISPGSNVEKALLRRRLAELAMFRGENGPAT